MDFQKSEYYAIRKTLSSFGIEPTDAVCDLYVRINLAHWKALERKEITREQLSVSRFVELFDRLGICADAESCGALYYENLGQGHHFLDGALDAVTSLSKQYQLYIVSNGTADVQHRRIASAGIAPLFRDIFISQEMGADKPDKRFFDNVFAAIPDFDPAGAMIVGDSLTSDIQGGKNAGIATCWINPKHRPHPAHLKPDYQLENITQLEALLQSI